MPATIPGSIRDRHDAGEGENAQGDSISAVSLQSRSLHKTKRNAGSDSGGRPGPDFASLHPGYTAFTSASSSSSVGKRPNLFLENFSSPSTVISNRPPLERT